MVTSNVSRPTLTDNYVLLVIGSKHTCSKMMAKEMDGSMEHDGESNNNLRGHTLNVKESWSIRTIFVL